MFGFAGCNTTTTDITNTTSATDTSGITSMHDDAFISEAVTEFIPSLWYISDEERPYFMQNLYLLTEKEEALYIFDALEQGNIEQVETVLKTALENSANNISIEVMNDNIAYLSADFFPNTWALPVYSYIFDFLYEIREFEHLIIDLRGARGTNHIQFMQFVVRPNIQAENSSLISMYIFMTEGERGSSINSPVIGSAVVTTTENVVSRFDLPYLDSSITESMSYAAREAVTIAPFYLDFYPRFDGTIWILIDDEMDFGPKMVAWISGNAGFANIVGERIDFDIMNHPVFAEMAGDFIVTDAQGRILEYIEPSFYNHVGLDALETVLGVIAD